MTILDNILSTKKKEIEISQSVVPMEKLQELSRDCKIRDFNKALSGKSMSVISEIKRKSPSGEIWIHSDPIAIAKAYEIAGASAISVLTDETYFGGSIDFLKVVRDAVKLPILRKDFIISEYQIWESFVHGADAILLIVDALTPTKLEKFYEIATTLGLHVLVETHSTDSFKQLNDLEPKITGINCRNLKSMQTNIDWFKKYLPQLPESAIKVAESGIHSKEDLQFVKSLGYNASLIGTALMRNGTPQKTLSQLLDGVRT